MPSTIEFPFSDDEALPTIPVTLSHAGCTARYWVYGQSLINQVKALEFERLTVLNTQVANELLSVDKKERSKLTSAAFHHVEMALLRFG